MLENLLRDSVFKKLLSEEPRRFILHQASIRAGMG